MRTINLCKGKGVEGESHCVMAATSIVAEEPFSDKPKCVCPTITAALIKINDSCPSNEIREQLLGHLPWMIIGTNGDIISQIKRARMFADYATNISRFTNDPVIQVYSDSAYDYAYTYIDLIFANNICNYINYTNNCNNSAVYCAKVVIELSRIQNNSSNFVSEIKKFIDFIEEQIIPVHTTMVVEPEYNFDRLVSC